MGLVEHEIDIPTGRRDSDDKLRVYLFADDMVALAVRGGSDRTKTILLTLEQGKKLQQALAKLIPIGEEAVSRRDEAA
jgi:hypothetical protein